MSSNRGRSDTITRPNVSVDDQDESDVDGLQERIDELENRVENQQQTLTDLVRMVNDLQQEVEER